MTKFVLLCTSVLMLSACGGGGSGSGDSGGSDFSTNVVGKWIVDCDYDAEFEVADREEFEFTSTQLISTYSEFSTSDCSNAADNIATLTLDVETVGTQTTSFCVADKIDLTLTKIVVNGIELTSDQAQLYGNPLGSKFYSIVCEEDDKLYGGEDDGTLDSSSDAKRPVEVDTQYPASRVQ